MRILYIITKSEAGGAQTHVLQLAQYMQSKGHNVAVMANQGGYLEKISNFQFLISNQFLNSNFKTSGKIKFYRNKYFKNSYNLFLGMMAMREIKKVVEDFKPDIVHCHSTVAGFWTRLTLRQVRQAHCKQAQGKLPVIFTAHGWGFTEGASFFRKMLVSFFERIAARYCDKIICVSEYDRELALKYKIVHSTSSGQALKDKLVVIHNGVEIEEAKFAEPYSSYASVKTSASEKRKAKNNSLKCKIVFVGRLAEPKNPELLLQALGDLPDEIKNKAWLTIIGDGPKKEFLISNFKFLKNVEFLGALGREKVFEALKESDIFVLTSNYEGFPYTVLEAMSCGLPVVASDVGGVKEAVTGETGFLIKAPSSAKSFGRVKDSVEELKKALTELIENSKLREEMGRAGRERVEKEFSLEGMLKETEKVYNDNTFTL